MRDLGAQAAAVRADRPRASNMERDLAQAGHPHGIDVPKLLGIQAVLIVALVLLVPAPRSAPLRSARSGGRVLRSPASGSPSSAPSARRPSATAVSDTIDQLTICVESGMGFDAALVRVATTNEGPLAAELQHTVSDMRAGVPRDQALRALAERTQIPEIKTLVQALIQAQRNGTPLADTLRIQAAEVSGQAQAGDRGAGGQAGHQAHLPHGAAVLPGDLRRPAGSGRLGLHAGVRLGR